MNNVLKLIVQGSCFDFFDYSYSLLQVVLSIRNLLKSDNVIEYTYCIMNKVFKTWFIAQYISELLSKNSFILRNSILHQSIYRPIDKSCNQAAEPSQKQPAQKCCCCNYKGKSCNKANKTAMFDCQRRMIQMAFGIVVLARQAD